MNFFLAFFVDLLYYIYNMYKDKIFKVLRIVFCALTVALAAAMIFVFIYAGWLWGVLALVLAFVSGALMATFKMLQEKEEQKKNPPPPHGDFIFGKIDSGEKEDK